MMNSMSHLKRIFLILPVLFLVIFTSSCSQEEIRSLTIGTGGLGGNYHMTGLAIARIVNKQQGAHGFRLQDIQSSGSVSNIDAIMAGNIEFGVAQADRQYQAVNGLAEWKERGPQKDLRSVFSLYNESVTLVAASDSGISTIHDLRRKRVDIGPPGSGIRQNAIDALSAAEIAWEKDIEAHGGKLEDRLAMLLHSELDAFFHTVGHPSKDIKFATFSVRGARLIPLDNIEMLVSKYPHYSKSVIPIGLYPRAANKTDVETIGVKATFVTSAKVPDDIVYAVTRAVFDDLESLGKYDPILTTFSKGSMLEGLTAPLHPGALRYYREIGLQVPPSAL